MRKEPFGFGNKVIFGVLISHFKKLGGATERNDGGGGEIDFNAVTEFGSGFKSFRTTREIRKRYLVLLFFFILLFFLIFFFLFFDFGLGFKLLLFGNGCSR